MKFMLLITAFIKNLSEEVQNFPANILDNFCVPLGPVLFNRPKIHIISIIMIWINSIQYAKHFRFKWDDIYFS